MQITGRVVDVNGAASAGTPVEVRGTVAVRIVTPAHPSEGRFRPVVTTATGSTASVVVTTGSDGTFFATMATPTAGQGELEGDRIVGPPTYGATARALGSVGETLASAAADHLASPNISVGTVRLPQPGPAFQTAALAGALDLGAHRRARLAEIVAVGAGLLRLDAVTMKRVAEPPDELHPHPIWMWEDDQPAGVRAFPVEGTGAHLDGSGSASVTVAAGDGGPRHVWALEVENPTAKAAHLSWSAHYTTTHPIVKKKVSLRNLNDSVSRLLQLGPTDTAEPPIRLVIGQQFKVIVRSDWQQFFGTISGYDVPGIVHVNETGTARPRIAFRASGDKLVLDMNVTCDVGTITGDVAGGWLATFTVSNIAAEFTFSFGVERQMIVPVCTGRTNASVDIDSSIVLDLVTLGLSQAAAQSASGAITSALRKAVEFDIPAALNAKRFELGKAITAFFAGPGRPVLDLRIDTDGVLITYVDDEHDPLPSLDPQAPDPNLNKIDHVVVLMMENRSFDTMLGYLERDQGRADVDGLTRPDGRGNTGQFNVYHGEQFQPFKLTSTQVPVDVDPCHGSACVAAQIDATRGMGGFVESFGAKVTSHPGARSVAREVMGYHGADHVWAYDAIASGFTVCDRWFSSHPGPTWPNRYFMISCHLGIGPAGGPDVDMTGDPTPIDMDTIFDELTRRNVSWRYFEHDVGFIRKIAKYTLDFTNVVTIDHPDTGFFDLAARGELPSVTFIDPNFVDFPDGRPSNDDHPPIDIAPGQELVAQIYNALRASPNWGRTLFVITYDEHGGIYDHYPPPADDHAPPGSLATLGVRVPAMVISPWVPARSVSHQTFEHTAVAKTIFRRFTPEAMPDLSPRFRAAPDLGSLLSLDTARTDAPPSIERPASVRAWVRPATPAPVAADDSLRRTLAALRAHVDAHRPPLTRRPR